MPENRVLILGPAKPKLSKQLSDWGYRIVGAAKSVDNALELVDDVRPDVVLVHGVKFRADELDVFRSTNLQIPIIQVVKSLSPSPQTDHFFELTEPLEKSKLDGVFQNWGAANDAKPPDDELARALNSLDVGMIFTDAKGRITHATQIVKKLLNMPETDLIGQPIQSILSKMGSICADQPEKMPLDRPAAFNLATKVNQHASVTLEVESAPIQDTPGRISGAVFSLRDVSVRRKSEQELILLSEAVAQTSDGIAVLDNACKIVFVNNAFASMHGYSSEDLIGKPWTLFHSGDQVGVVKAALKKLKKQGRFSGEILHSHEDGSFFPSLMHASLLKHPNGSSIGIIVTLRDITDFNAGRQALESSHEALAAYSSSLEAKVEARTRDLESSRAELKRYSESLEKTNEALKIIIEGIEQQKKDFEKKVVHNLNLTVRPILDQLRVQDLPETIQFLLKSLDFNLTNMFSSFGFNMLKEGHLLTPREIRISEMIRSGLLSKQIAKVMGISPQTVLVHRRNIRRKLSLGKTGQNLASFLKANM